MSYFLRGVFLTFFLRYPSVSFFFDCKIFSFSCSSFFSSSSLLFFDFRDSLPIFKNLILCLCIFISYFDFIAFSFHWSLLFLKKSINFFTGLLYSFSISILFLDVIFLIY